jgi:hypothetical protein
MGAEEVAGGQGCELRVPAEETGGLCAFPYAWRLLVGGCGEGRWVGRTGSSYEDDSGSSCKLHLRYEVGLNT